MEQHLFIADTHFGHSNIHEKFRTQFESQEEHDTYIHNNILEAGDKTKTLWILGDSFLKEREFWRLDEYRKKYQQVNIVLGNHCHTGLPRYIFRVDKGGQPVFNNVNVFGVLKKFGFWLSHVPVPDYELYRGHNIHGHCVDMDTEILTTSGWKKYDDIVVGEEILSVNPQNHKEIIRDKVLNKFKRSYTGDMITVKNRSFSMRVTDEHRVPYISQKGGFNVLSAKQILDRSVLRTISSGYANNSGVSLPDNILELYIAIAADGSITPANLVRFILNKERKITYIKGLLERCDIFYKSGENKSGKYIHFKLPDCLNDWNIKGLDLKLLNCNEHQAEIIREAYRNTDGNRNIIFTSKPSEKDILSLVFIQNGYRVTILERIHGYGKKLSFSLSVTPKKPIIGFTRFRNYCKVEKVVNEDVWCVETNSSFWFAKRGSSIYLTGNCHSKKVGEWEHLDYGFGGVEDDVFVEDKRYFCVSCENIDYRPISLQKIKELRGWE